MTKVEEQSAVAAAAEAAAGGKKAPAPAKGGAAPAAPPDFESLLPVPSKQVLDAALRCLASLLSPGSNGEHGGSSGAGSVFPPTDWLIAHADMEHLVLLVQHHSPRVQVSNGKSHGCIHGRQYLGLEGAHACRRMCHRQVKSSPFTPVPNSVCKQ